MVDDINLRVEELKKKLSPGEDSQKESTQYQYSHVDLETVINNPTEYIIPQCLPACRILWDKNIETFMVSNNDDKKLYVMLGDLSPQNVDLMKILIQQDPRYYFDGYRKTYVFSVSGIDDSAAKELEGLADRLYMQDTLRFKTGEDFLADFKTSSGKYAIDERGNAIVQENPLLSNCTLEEALERTGKRELYVEEEDRVYDSVMYLKWHQRYLEALSKIMDKQEKEQESGSKHS